MNDVALTALSETLAGAAERALAGVVTVWAPGRRPISGTVVGGEQVLTVDHALGGDDVTVQSEDGQFSGTVAGRDPTTDLALVRVPGLRAPALRVGPSPRLGTFVLALARPAGGPMVSGGVISGEGRGRRGTPGDGWLLTDARPYPGFSGGALVNEAGEFVGLVNAGLSRGEIMALLAVRAVEVAGELAVRGTLPRGYLGVATQEVRLPGGPSGLLVVSVEPGSPAGEGGVLLGDVLLRWNGEPVGDGEVLLGRVAGAAGTAVRLGLLRGGQARDLTVTVGTRGRA